MLANQPSMSLYLLVVLYCSMYFRRHGGGSRSGSGLWLSDRWYVGLPCVLRACAGGLWTVCESAIGAIGSIRLYTLHNNYIYYIASTYRLFLSMASVMTNNQNVLDNFGGVDANSLCRLLNNNYDNGHPA